MYKWGHISQDLNNQIDLEAGPVNMFMLGEDQRYRKERGVSERVSAV